MKPYKGKFTSETQTSEPAIFASSDGEGVHGESTSVGVAAIAGVQLNTTSTSNGAGIYGECRGGGAGVVGVNDVVTSGGPSGRGGYFRSQQKEGILAETKSPTDAAIAGLQNNPSGTGAAIYGQCISGPGGLFKSEQQEGIHAETKSLTHAAIAGFQNNPNSTGAAIYGECITGVDGKPGTAGFFVGNVVVTGDISLPGADFAEDFTIKDEVFAEPGTVMALNSTGELVPCVDPYEKRVVGVVAGAGSHRTGIIMDKQEKSAVRRQPIALVGKVFCKVDASYGSIEVGDLLTSSATHGHAMKVSNPNRAFGSVLGKAMAPQGKGLGLIPILISLQ
ncbi:MAG: hypothetical protein E8D52_01135 [Nitrospira sp.]|nr:MAG: hypothetical protein E8D52_01135 [Nitrospira sp.]